MHFGHYIIILFTDPVKVKETIGEDLRTMGKFLGSSGRNNWQFCEHDRFKPTPLW